MPICTYCGKNVSPDAKRCNKCGSDFAKNPPKSELKSVFEKLLTIGIVVVGVLALLKGCG